MAFSVFCFNSYQYERIKMFKKIVTFSIISLFIFTIMKNVYNMLQTFLVKFFDGNSGTPFFYKRRQIVQLSLQINGFT